MYLNLEVRREILHERYRMYTYIIQMVNFKYITGTCTVHVLLHFTCTTLLLLHTYTCNSPPPFSLALSARIEKCTNLFITFTCVCVTGVRLYVGYRCTYIHTCTHVYINIIKYKINNLSLIVGVLKTKNSSSTKIDYCRRQKVSTGYVHLVYTGR